MRNHKHVWRSVIALILTFVLVFGTASTSFATMNNSSQALEKDVIKYVSFGDSMTNGYGLTNYHTQGYYGYGEEAYPNQFASWLEKETGKTVEHAQLAISAMRAEDLLFTLKFPMKDGEPDPNAVAIAQAKKDRDDEFEFWTEKYAATWNNTFTTGDYWTWDNFTDGRFQQYCGGTAVAVKEFKARLADADLISMCIGNANFGVFLLDGIMKTIGFSGTPDQMDWLDLDRAMENCDPEIKAEVLKLETTVDTILAEEMTGDLADIVTYTVVSFAISYADVLEHIMEINPDADVILVGIMNTLNGLELTITTDGEKKEIAMNDLMGLLIKPVNAYIAGLPETLQEKNNELYGHTTFYYAEAPNVECMVNTYEDAIKDPNSVVRQRFVEEIIDEGDGMIWEAVKPAFKNSKLLGEANLVPITLDDIESYEAGNTAGFSDDKIISCAVYLAFEDAIVKCSKTSKLDMAALTSLATGFESTVGIVVEELEKSKKLASATGTKELAAALITELSDIIVGDETLQGLMHMFARSIIGSGLGAHPSAAGHDALADAVINTYKDGYTADDKYSVAMDDFMTTLLEFGSDYFDSQAQIVNKLKKAVNNLDKYAKLQLDNYSSVKAAYAGNGFDKELNTVEKELKEMRKAIKEVKAEIGTLSTAVDAADSKNVEIAATDVAAKMAVVDAATDELKAAVNVAAKKAAGAGVDNSALKAVASEMRSYVSLAYATENIMKSDSRKLAYAPSTETSYYVALGDSSTITNPQSNTYGRKLVKELDLNYRSNFVNEGKDGMRADDLLYILDETYEPDDYGKENFGSRIDKSRSELTANIKKADLITVGFSNNTLLDIAIGQMTKAFGGRDTYDVDWSRYLDADTAAQVAEIIDGIEVSVVEATAGMSGSGINMDNIGPAVRAAMESYLYNYLGFYNNYQNALNKIAEINPDAKIVLVGVSNAFDDTVLTIGEDQLPLGDYMGELVDLMNLQQKAFATMTGKATYVDAPAVEVSSNAYAGNVNIITFVSQLMIKGTDTLAASSNGHSYIKDQIMAAMKVVDAPTEAVIDQLTGLYDMLNVNVNQLSEADYQIKAARSEYDALTADQKAKVDADLVQLLEFCEADFDYLKVAAVGNSSVTGVTAKLPTKTKLTVSWKGIDGVQKYAVKIYRNGVLWKTANTTNKSVSLTNVYRGCTYKVTVQPVAAINGTTFEGIAKTASVTSKLEKANIAVKKAGAKVKVSSKDQNSTGFQVWVSTNKNFKKNVTKKTFKTNGNALKNKAAALKKDTNYIKVRAYTTIGGKTVYGAWSSVKTIKR